MDLDEFTTFAAPMPQPSADEILANCRRLMLEIPLPRLSPMRIAVYREVYIQDWSVVRYPFMPEAVFAGIHAYAQLEYAISTKPNVLETDPGPLDARVP